MWEMALVNCNCNCLLSDKLSEGVRGRRAVPLPFPSSSPLGLSLRCQASKWEDRLFTDFHPSESSEAKPTATATAPVYASALASERKVTLPIDFYQVLGAETHYLGDGIKRAYEAKVSRVPEDGYSEDAIMGRKQILQTACETLANPRSRGDYNQELLEDEDGTLMREVPWNKVPGALCLLQEMGEADVVLQVGQTLLQERLPKSFKRDVVLAMALSYVDISREAMAESPPDVVKSCEVLERALKILQQSSFYAMPKLCLLRSESLLNSSFINNILIIDHIQKKCLMLHGSPAIIFIGPNE
eukprot:Gb_34154 [translate_table: standard]